MRIALLSVSADLGGSETSLLTLAGGLAHAPGFEPIVIVPREGPLADRARAAGASVRVLSMPPALAAFGEWSMRGVTAIGRRGAAVARAIAAARTYERSLGRLLDDLDPHVVHSNGLKLHVLAARAAPRRAPLVWHIHEFVGVRPLTRRLLRHYGARPAAIVANSLSVAADLLSALGPDRPVTTIYNAVDLSEFAPDGPAADLDALAGLGPASAGTIRVGLLATFARWKGHEVFLRAIQTTPDVRGYVIGGSVYDTAGSQFTIEELRARARALGVADRVGFTGFVSRPSTALRALDIVVHASTEPEPFGLVIAEGMACGKPVLVSLAGGAAELVTDDVDAIGVTPGQPPALSAAIARCARDGALRSRLGHAARRTAERRFDPAQFVMQFTRIYSHAATTASGVAM